MSGVHWVGVIDDDDDFEHMDSSVVSLGLGCRLVCFGLAGLASGSVSANRVCFSGLCFSSKEAIVSHKYLLNYDYTERQTDLHNMYLYLPTHTYIPADLPTYLPAETVRQTERHNSSIETTDGQTNSQPARQTDRQTYIYIHT